MMSHLISDLYMPAVESGPKLCNTVLGCCRNTVGITKETTTTECKHNTTFIFWWLLCGRKQEVLFCYLVVKDAPVSTQRQQAPPTSFSALQSKQQTPVNVVHVVSDVEPRAQVLIRDYDNHILTCLTGVTTVS